MSNNQLLGYAGKNALRITMACPISAFTLTVTAIAETIPGVSAYASMATELTDSNYNTFESKKMVGTVGGGPVAVVTDLTKTGYVLLFEDKAEFTEGVFKHTRQSYPATKHLAQK